MPPSKDYEKFSKSVTNDLSQASFAAQAIDDKSARTKVKIRESCLEAFIPSNSSLEIEQITFHHLKFGDFVLIRDKGEIVIRRFVRFEVRGSSEIVIHVVNQQWKIAEEFHDGAISGRIQKVEVKGKPAYDPRKLENSIVQFTNKLTYFGTSTPWSRFFQGMGVVGRMLKPVRKAPPQKRKK